MRYYSEHDLMEFIHDASAKCRRNIDMCETIDQVDTAINMCNSFTNSVVAILNSEDRRWLATKFNMHRRWCERAFTLLQSEIAELDDRITKRKSKLENVDSEKRIGFN